MRAVQVVEGLWCALVLFLSNFTLPSGLIFILGTWVTLIASVLLFASQKRVAALALSYVAVLAGALLLGFGGGGPPHLFE